MYDAASEKVLPAGEKGRAVTLKEPEESETPARKSLIATGLEGGTFFAIEGPSPCFQEVPSLSWSQFFLIGGSILEKVQLPLSRSFPRGSLSY